MGGDFSILTPPLSLSEADAGPVAILAAACLTEAWSVESFASLLCQKDVEGWKIVEGEHLQAFLMLRRVQTEAELLVLAVDSAWRRQRLAQGLLDHALRQCTALGVQEMFLEVRLSNAAAIALYKTAGFLPAGRRKDYYVSASGHEDALVMTRQALI